MVHTQNAWQLSARWKNTPHPFQQRLGKKSFKEKERDLLSWEYGTKVQRGSASEPRMDIQLPGNRFLSLDPQFHLGPPFIITLLSLSFPVTQKGEKTVIFSASIFLSSRNDYLILPTHYLFCSLFSAGSTSKTCLNLSQNSFFFWRAWFHRYCLLLQQALGHISCLK